MSEAAAPAQPRARLAVWRALVGFEGYYEVSDQGQVRSLDRVITRSTGAKQFYPGCVLTPTRQAYGYLSVQIRGRRRYVHALVLEAFVGPCPPNAETLHKDGVPENNRLENLHYGTPSENAYDRVRHGTHAMVNRRLCPQEHHLLAPNLVPSALRAGRRACLACERGRHVVQHAALHGEVLDLKAEADKHYAAIVAGVELPRRRRARGNKFSDSLIAEIRARYAAGQVTQVELANEYDISPSHVCNLVNGRARAAS